MKMLSNCKIIGENVPYEVYSRQGPEILRGHPEFSMSRSEIVAFFDCPEKWINGTADKGDTESTRFGKLLETLECSGGLNSSFALEPLKYTNSKGLEVDWDYHSPTCRKWRDEREAQGITVVSRETLDEVKGAAKLCAEYPPRAGLFACSKKQVMVTGFWVEGDFEIPLRCLIDLVPDKSDETWGKCLADGKTARNGNPANWARVVSGEAYDVQAALSLDLYVAATNEDRTDWIFPLSENLPPFHVVKPMPALSQEFIEWGRQKYQSALRIYAECLKQNKWPSYPVAGMMFGSTQILGPDDLWEYRKTGGMSKMIEYKPPTSPTNFETDDITP